MSEITYHNYDFAFKEAFSLFEHKSLSFLGLDLPKISGFMETEFTEVETHDDFLDLTFRLEDGPILHLEEEIDLSIQDLSRFAHYDLRLYNRYKKRIHTVVLTPACGTRGTQTLDTGSLQYKVIHVILSDKNGGELMEKIRSALDAGDEINELELIFLPLMRSNMPVDLLLKEIINLGRRLPDPHISKKVQGLILILSNRIVDTSLLDELWEELHMLKVIKYAEEKGIEKGQIQVIKRQLNRKFGWVPQDLINKIDTMDEISIENLSLELIDMQSIDDLKKFINAQ